MADKPKRYTVDKYGNSFPPEPLKPCPCCEAPAEFRVGIVFYVVRCSSCKLQLMDTDDERVCRKWNKRPKPPKPPKAAKND